MLRLAPHDGVGLTANRRNRNECIVGSTGRELIHGSTDSSDESITLAANTCRGRSVSVSRDTALHVDRGSWILIPWTHALVTKVATSPAALVIFFQIPAPSLTGGEPRVSAKYSRYRAVCLTDRVDEAPQVLSCDEDRCRRGGWRGGWDWDWLCDRSRQEGRGNKDDCDEASEHICLSKRRAVTGEVENRRISPAVLWTTMT